MQDYNSLQQGATQELVPFPANLIIEVARFAGLDPKSEYSDPHRFTCRCPFPGHADRHPSCALDGRKNAFFCRSLCNRGGGVVEFAQLVKIDWRSVMTTMSGREPVRVREPSHIESAWDVESVWHTLAASDERGEAELRRRHLHDAVAADLVRFHVGGIGDGLVDRWAGDGFRIAVKSLDVAGRLASIVFRSTRRDVPKNERFKMLGHDGIFFGTPSAVPSARRVVMAEGLADFLALSLARTDETTAVLCLRSSGATPEGAIRTVFDGFTGDVVLFPDNDGAGHKAVRRVADVLRDLGVRHRVTEPACGNEGGDLCDVWEGVQGRRADFSAQMKRLIDNAAAPTARSSPPRAPSKQEVLRLDSRDAVLPAKAVSLDVERAKQPRTKTPKAVAATGKQERDPRKDDRGSFFIQKPFRFYDCGITSVMNPKLIELYEQIRSFVLRTEKHRSGEVKRLVDAGLLVARIKQRDLGLRVRLDPRTVCRYTTALKELGWLGKETIETYHRNPFVVYVLGRRDANDKEHFYFDEWLLDVWGAVRDEGHHRGVKATKLPWNVREEVVRRCLLAAGAPKLAMVSGGKRQRRPKEGVPKISQGGDSAITPGVTTESTTPGGAVIPGALLEEENTSPSGMDLEEREQEGTKSVGPAATPPRDHRAAGEWGENGEDGSDEVEDVNSEQIDFLEEIWRAERARVFPDEPFSQWTGRERGYVRHGLLKYVPVPRIELLFEFVHQTWATVRAWHRCDDWLPSVGFVAAKALLQPALGWKQAVETVREWEEFAPDSASPRPDELQERYERARDHLGQYDGDDGEQA